MSTPSLFLLAPRGLFLVAMLLWRIAPLRAMAAGGARWCVLPAFTLSGLHVQDCPAPHSVMEHPKGQLDSTHTCSILENRQSIFRR